MLKELGIIRIIGHINLEMANSGGIKMTHEERIQQIKEHFQNISSEQLVKNLKKAGLGEISSLDSANLKLIEFEQDFYTCSIKLLWETEGLSDFQQFSFCEVA